MKGRSWGLLWWKGHCGDSTCKHEMPVKTEIAWAAGFFDGEGTVFVRHTLRHKGGTTGKYYPLTTVEIAATQTDRQPLDRFHRVVKVGAVHGPYKRSKKNKKKWKPYYRWETAGRPSVAKVLHLLWPYMSEPKQDQAVACWIQLSVLRTAKSPKLPPLPL